MPVTHTRRILSALAALTMLAAVLAAATSPAIAAQATSSADAQFVDALNAERAEAGLDPLIVVSSMSDVSRAWSHQMADRGSLVHSSDLWEGAPSGSYIAGENIGWHYSVDGAVRMFMNSPPHAANVLNPKFNAIGVGTVTDSEGRIWTTHRFAASRDSLAPTSPKTCFGKQATIEAVPGKTTRGTPGDDVIVGTAGRDVILGGGGDDLICGRAGADTIKAGPGSDQVKGQRGADRVYGGAGRDYLSGGAGDDVIKGGKGSDTIIGNGGKNSLSGGAGRDSIRR